MGDAEPRCRLDLRDCDDGGTRVSENKSSEHGRTPSRRRRLAVSAGAGAVLLVQLSACALPGDRPVGAVSSAQAAMPDAWHASEAAGSAGAPTDRATLARWWTAFSDPTLSALVERSLEANTDIAAALGRLRSARAALVAARGALLPGLSAGGSVARQEQLTSPRSGASTFDLGFDAAWEIDLFGQLRGGAAASRADVAASEASLFDVQRIIAAEVALNYVTLRDAQARLAIANSNIAIQRDNLQIAEWRYQAGLANALEVEQARTLVAQTEASLPPLRQTISAAINQIDVLTGQAPGTSATLLQPAGPLPSSPALTDIGLPADLLSRRPDVLAAQHALEAEVIRIGVARADLYPALRLSGSISTTAASAGGLFDSILGGLIGSITAPIFQGGQIRARIEQQRGSADVALANYRGTILTALQDVENALVAARIAREREEALDRAERAAIESVRLAEIRYRGGEVDFQVLLDAQRSLLSVQDSKESARAAQSTAAIQLFKALGGGWPAPGAADQGPTG